MASCKLIKDSSISKLMSAGVLSKNFKVNNIEALEKEQEFVRHKVRLLYGKDFENPLGTVSGNVFNENDILEKYEEALKNEASERYIGVSQTGPIRITDDTEMILVPKDIQELYYEGPKNTYPSYRKVGTEEWQTGESLEDLFSKSYADKKFIGTATFIADVVLLKNRDLLAAAFPGLMEPAYKGIEAGRSLEKSLKIQALDSSMGTVLDGVVDKHLSEDFSSLNIVLNRALNDLNTYTETSLVRKDNIDVMGSASTGIIQLDVVNIGMRYATEEARLEKLAKVYMHEKVHIVSNGLMKNKQFNKKIVELFMIARNVAIENGIDSKQFYGLTNVYEFMAEGLTDRNFQLFLAEIPYDTNKSVFEKIIDYIARQLEDVLGVKINDTVLEELIRQHHSQVLENISNNIPLYNINKDYNSILDGIDTNGVYVGEQDWATVAAWADSNGIIYGDDNKFRLGNRMKTTLSKSSLLQRLDFDKNNIYYQQLLHGNSLENYYDDIQATTTVESPLIDFYEDKFNINGDINALKQMNMHRIEIPSPLRQDKNHDKYSISGVPHFRATSYLGFGSASGPLVTNAVKIGNVVDELGKRIFSEGYEEADYTYEEVNKFVKKEAWEAAQDAEPGIKFVDFDKEYKNPVSEVSFYAVSDELIKWKFKLMDDFGVVKFHSDMVVWDKDKLVAGEIDVLAEHADGSYTVIDLKTRRQGLFDYNAPEDENYNTKTKHTRQTSLYSLMLNQLGFKTNDPMILMAQPLYDEVAVDNQEFVDISEGKKVELIQLKYEENLFDYALGITSESTEGAINRAIRNKIENNRQAYYNWFREMTEITDALAGTEDTANRDKHIGKLQKNLESIAFKLEEYQNLLKKQRKGLLTKELNELKEQIETQIQKEIEDTTIIEQLRVIEDFFSFGREQLAELMKSLDVPSKEPENRREAYFKVKNYKDVFRTASELAEELEVLKENNIITPEEYGKVKKAFDLFSKLNSDLSTQLNMTIKNLGREALIEDYLGSKFEIDLKNQFYKEAQELYKDENISKKELNDKIQTYINQKRRDPKILEELRVKYTEEIQQLNNEVQYDISNAAFWINSDVEVNNQHVQLLHMMILRSKQEFSQEANTRVLGIANLEKELKLSRKEQEALITVSDVDGASYLIGKYKLEFYDRIKELRKDIDAAEEIAAEDPKLSAIRKLKAIRAYKAFLKANSVYDKNTLTFKPISKWENPAYYKLSDRQKKARDMFRDITIQSHRDTDGMASLVKRAPLGVAYLQLPGIRQTKWGAAIRGESMKFFRKAYDEAFKIEMDDTTESELIFDKNDNVYRTYTDLKGDQIYIVPIFFRGNPEEMQNKDLWTIYAMEAQNGIRFRVDNKLANKATVIIDMVKVSKFYKTVGVSSEKVESLFKAKKSKEAQVIDGDASTVVKMLNKMLKNNVYSMTQEYAGNVKVPFTNAKIDVHRAAQLVSSYTAFASMSFKVLSAGNNWVTGNIGIALESIGEEFYNKSNLKNAKAFYARNIMGIVKDIGSPAKTNIVNQLMVRYDTISENSALNNEFEKDVWWKQYLDPGMTLGGYQMGEHEMHATVMLSIMDSLKILDSKGRYIKKDGKTTTVRSEGMTLLDSYTLDENGILIQNIDPQDYYTEHDLVNPLGGGGESVVRALIKDRVTRTQGAFDKSTQAELNRQWWGKLFVQFKKHIAPQTLNRFRGVGKITKETDDLKDHEKYFNYKAKTEEYGYYTTFIRHMYQVLKQEKFNILGWKQAGADRWKKMTKHEKANMTKTISELTYIAFVGILAAMVAAAADEDDDQALWAAAYLLKRQQGEAGLQYYHPGELWRLTDSPMAAFKHVKNLMDMFAQLGDPTDEYVSGANAGRNKLLRRAQKAFLLDRLDQFVHGYNKSLFTGLDKY